MAPLPSLCPSPTGISTSISTLPHPFAMSMPVALSGKVFRLSCLFYIPKLSVYFWQGGKANTASDKRSINRVYAVYNTYSWQLATGSINDYCTLPSSLLFGFYPRFDRSPMSRQSVPRQGSSRHFSVQLSLIHHMQINQKAGKVERLLLLSAAASLLPCRPINQMRICVLIALIKRPKNRKLLPGPVEREP